MPWKNGFIFRQVEQGAFLSSFFGVKNLAKNEEKKTLVLLALDPFFRLISVTTCIRKSDLGYTRSVTNITIKKQNEI